MNEKDIYQKLVEYLENPLSELPESEFKMPMFTSRITPEEAEFIIGLPWRATSLEDIADMKDMSPEELEPILKKLCERGLVFETIREDSRRFRLLDAGQMFYRMPYWPGSDDEDLKKTAQLANRYYMDGWREQGRSAVHTGLRSLPINETLEDKKQILPFEDVQQVIEQYEYYTVSHCPCRERHRLDPDYVDSKHPSEVCLHFDELGRYCVEHGMGREITKEETLEILKKAADSGLVHGLGNHQNSPDTLCNCDPTYCTMFRPYHHLDFDKAMDPSNYKLKVSSPETCRACGLCIKRCPMDAIQMQVSEEATNKWHKVVKVDTDLCIGCGVCVHKCPTDSIILERREETTEPPIDGRELVQRNFADRQAAKEKQA